MEQRERSRSTLPSPVWSVHLTNLGKIAAALFVIGFPCTSPPGQPVQVDFSALGGGVASVSCHSLPFTSVHNSCAIRCSNPIHVALSSEFFKYLISASFRVLGRGVVADNSLMAHAPAAKVARFVSRQGPALVVMSGSIMSIAFGYVTHLQCARPLSPA